MHTIVPILLTLVVLATPYYIVTSKGGERWRFVALFIFGAAVLLPYWLYWTWQVCCHDPSNIGNFSALSNISNIGNLENTKITEITGES